MEPHAVRGIPDAVTENPVAATECSVTATVPPGRSPVPEPAPLRRLAAKSVKSPSPDVRAMKARAAAIVQELETGGKNGKNKNNRELSRQSQ